MMFLFTIGVLLHLIDPVFKKPSYCSNHCVILFFSFVFVFCIQILRNHVMVRVGGGWDTLEHYLDKHDPCMCNGKKIHELLTYELLTYRHMLSINSQLTTQSAFFICNLLMHVICVFTSCFNEASLLYPKKKQTTKLVIPTNQSTNQH